jgi:hypothetical protein
MIYLCRAGIQPSSLTNDSPPKGGERRTSPKAKAPTVKAGSHECVPLRRISSAFAAEQERRRSISTLLDWTSSGTAMLGSADASFARRMRKRWPWLSLVSNLSCLRACGAVLLLESDCRSQRLPVLAEPAHPCKRRPLAHDRARPPRANDRPHPRRARFAHAVATRDARYATDPSAMVDEARRILSRESARRRRRRSGSRHSGSTA